MNKYQALMEEKRNLINMQNSKANISQEVKKGYGPNEALPKEKRHRTNEQNSKANISQEVKKGYGPKEAQP